jgi:isopentenyl phosphate kinase
MLTAIVAEAELAAGVAALSAAPAAAAAVVYNEKALSSSLTAVEGVLLASPVTFAAVVPGRTK